MRLFALLSATALAAACGAHGSCCDDGDCWGSFVCSQDCSENGGHQGTCLQRCQVDLDCSGGDVCDDIRESCACEPPADGGTVGSCPVGANAGG